MQCLMPDSFRKNPLFKTCYKRSWLAISEILDWLGMILSIAHASPHAYAHA